MMMKHVDDDDDYSDDDEEEDDGDSDDVSNDKHNDNDEDDKMLKMIKIIKMNGHSYKKWKSTSWYKISHHHFSRKQSFNIKFNRCYWWSCTYLTVTITTYLSHY